MRAELKVGQLEQKLSTVRGEMGDRIHDLQGQADRASAQYADAYQEVSALESEKYQLVADIEVLEEELDDANASTKRCCDAPSERDPPLLPAATSPARAQPPARDRTPYRSARFVPRPRPQPRDLPQVL